MNRMLKTAGKKYLLIYIDLFPNISFFNRKIHLYCISIDYSIVQNVKYVVHENPGVII